MTDRPEREGREGDTQPMPVKRDGPIMHELLIEELPVMLRSRLELGIKRYGQPLQAFNGRDAAQDVMDELVDGLVYARQTQIEIAFMRDIIVRVRSRFGRTTDQDSAWDQSLWADIKMVLGD